MSYFVVWANKGEKKTHKGLDTNVKAFPSGIGGKRQAREFYEKKKTAPRCISAALHEVGANPGDPSKKLLGFGDRFGRR